MNAKKIGFLSYFAMMRDVLDSNHCTIFELFDPEATASESFAVKNIGKYL